MPGREDLDIPDPEVANELDKMPGAGPVPTDIPSARIAFDNLIVVRARKAARPFLPHDSQYSVQDHRITVEGGEITVRCAIPTPAGPDDRTFPLMLWTHGGGFIFGPLDMDDLLLRTLCVELQIVVVNVDYRLAPEHPWPTGLNDAYTALKWAAEHTALLSADLSKGFLVTGSSAGANLATVMAHRALNDPFFEGQRVTGQLLQMPLTCHPEGYPERYMHELLSLETSGDPRLLAKAHMIETYKKYAGPATDPECSPLLYSSHIGLAPAYVQICGIDPVRDEGLLYERLFREDGVKTKLEVYPGVGHGFSIHAPESKSAKKFDKDFKEGLRWLLQGGT
ncbi:hypothetical protein CERSUDRAFT_115948 [Gelatoporia subvermispora B]|uniref:Alpha/beta hydrolase fold-3 domain-containing protein n=1 Tax=Ceriporiopsis subvermispora (strain B) TaxID=914234 RepID=M2PIP7_CERS8|nr:hypothetical protein CERSUDRAFT_115948 [Gelatoporia subvermispora B]